MHRVASALTNALAYAKFTNPDIERATKNLINEMGEELDDENYEEGTGVEQALNALDDEMNNADTSSERLEEALENATPSNEDEEQA